MHYVENTQGQITESISKSTSILITFIKRTSPYNLITSAGKHTDISPFPQYHFHMCSFAFDMMGYDFCLMGIFFSAPHWLFRDGLKLESVSC